MHTLQANSSADGPLVRILVGLAATDLRTLRALGRPIPPSLSFDALVDTGAEASAIASQLLDSLTAAASLAPAKLLFSNMPAAGGLTPLAEYAVGVTIVHPSGDPRSDLVIRTHHVLELPIGTLGYQALIGRDILERCMFVWDGPSQVFTLGY